MKRHLFYHLKIGITAEKLEQLWKKHTLPNNKNLADGGNKEGEEEE